MACLHHTLGIQAPLGQCLGVKQQEAKQDAGDIGHLSEDPGANVWCVDNAAATFVVTTAEEPMSPQGGILTDLLPIFQSFVCDNSAHTGACCLCGLL